MKAPKLVVFVDGKEMECESMTITGPPVFTEEVDSFEDMPVMNDEVVLTFKPCYDIVMTRKPKYCPRWLYSAIMKWLRGGV
jgi:hypothetical protein